MRTSHKVTLLGLLTLLLAGLIGLELTNESGKFAALIRSRQAGGQVPQELVDQRPLETARSLAGEAETREERDLAEEAVRVADHEVDLAFSSALQSAKRNPKSESAAAKAVEDRIARSQARIEALQERVKQLTAKAAGAKAPQQENTQQRLELAQAQLALEQDELAGARADLNRAGGDKQSEIQRLLDQHEATEHANGNDQVPSASVSPPATGAPGSDLITQWTKWTALRARQEELGHAQQEASKESAELARDHDALEQRVQAAQTEKKNLAEQAANLLESGKSAAADSKQVAAQAVDSLRGLSGDQKELAGLDQRIQDFQQLSVVYSQWDSLVELRARAFLHRVIKTGLVIVLVVLLVFLLERLMERLFTRFISDRRQLHTLRAVARFAIQAVAVLVILFLIFGSPSQMSTVLGLAGAGLTVALKDFVVSFCGWFVLMGRNGIRVGDWVEINGVGGEVIEIGLLRTVLLEAGNWNESGHLTGRQIAFLNSFAVTGNYFNFSTSGQWLWDQLQVFIPPGEDPYLALEKIKGVVEKETCEDSKMAEEEWEHVTHRYDVKSFSPTPAVYLKSGSQGVEVTVRYMTRAKERSEMRARLNREVVKVLHEGKSGAPASANSAAS